MNVTETRRYEAESVARASLPPIAKHSQNKTNQPNKFVRTRQSRGERA